MSPRLLGRVARIAIAPTCLAIVLGCTGPIDRVRLNLRPTVTLTQAPIDTTEIEPAPEKRSLIVRGAEAKAPGS